MKTRILVVDDEPPVCELIREILAGAGIEAATITESARAAHLLQTQKFDAVFLDLHMPPPDGLELARRTRAAGFNQRTPIVMITADTDPAALTRGFQAGASFFLFKPLDRRGLLRILRATQGTIARERRRFQRVPVRRKVMLAAEGRRLEGTTLDLSLNGVLAQAPRPFPPGTRLHLKLELAAGAPPVEAQGRVMRLIGDDCMGIEITELAGRESERLQEFLLPLILKNIAAPLEPPA
jgi:DNA-binding response OmpR family regulator